MRKACGGRSSRALQRESYPVFTAEDGQAGVRFVQDHLSTIGTVISDLKMPGMDGLESPDLHRRPESGHHPHHPDRLRHRGNRHSGHKRRHRRISDQALRQPRTAGENPRNHHSKTPAAIRIGTGLTGKSPIPPRRSAPASTKSPFCFRISAISRKCPARQRPGTSPRF